MRNEFITKQDFEFYVGKSPKTFDRLKNKLLKEDESLVDNSRLHKSILDTNMSRHHKQIEKLLDFVVSRIGEHNEYWARFLVNYDWKVFGTITFDTPKSPDSARRYMDNIFNRTSKRFKIYTAFSTCEKNEHGYHIHFVLVCKDERVQTIIDYIQSQIHSKNVTEIEPYDINKLGSTYLTKMLDKNPDNYMIYNG